MRYHDQQKMHISSWIKRDSAKEKQIGIGTERAWHQNKSVNERDGSTLEKVIMTNEDLNDAKVK